MSTQRAKLDWNVPPQIADMLWEVQDGLSGDEVGTFKVNDSGESQVFDPISDFVRKASENRFEKSGAADPGWNEPIGVVIEEREVEKREVFLEKRSSAPGRIRFEIKEVDGERWRYGYDHAGEIVSWKVLPEIE
jgi:hypothetical protein